MTLSTRIPFGDSVLTLLLLLRVASSWVQPARLGFPKKKNTTVQKEVPILSANTPVSTTPTSSIPPPKDVEEGEYRGTAPLPESTGSLGWAGEKGFSFVAPPSFFFFFPLFFLGGASSAGGDCCAETWTCDFGTAKYISCVRQHLSIIIMSAYTKGVEVVPRLCRSVILE